MDFRTFERDAPLLVTEICRARRRRVTSEPHSANGRIRRIAWPYYRDFDPALASIRNEPKFKAIFADIERDMARQRAALAARPKYAPLDPAATGT